MGDVGNLVIQRLYRLCGAPNTIPEAELDAYFDEYVSSLSGFSDDVLKKAMDWMRDNHNTTFWPTPGAIHGKCREYIPSPPVQSPNWNDTARIKKTPASINRVREMAQQLRAEMNIKQMSAPSFKDFQRTDERIDTSRPAMEAKDKRWREAEKAQKIASRMIGEGE